MKKTVLFLLMLVCWSASFGQVIPSDCTPPSLLQSEYEWDVKNLACNRMFDCQSPDTAMVRIPWAWQDTILEGLAAIFNATALPQRDSIFNLYCVHDYVVRNHSITWQIMVFVDTSFSWTDPWQNLIATTGNPQIDSLMTNYDLEVISFSNFSFGSMAVLSSDSLWNVHALIKDFETVNGVMWGEPNYLIGTAGIINYVKTGNDRFYDFVFQWNDCFDGCDNLYAWKMKVNADCSVEFLGIYQWGAFQILPLPYPVNCNTFTGAKEVDRQEEYFRIYPNPASDKLLIASSQQEKVELSVFNVNGDLVKSAQLSGNVQLDIRDLPAGIYFLKITQKGKQLQVSKFVKTIHD